MRASTCCCCLVCGDRHVLAVRNHARRESATGSGSASSARAHWATCSSSSRPWSASQILPSSFHFAAHLLSPPDLLCARSIAMPHQEQAEGNEFSQAASSRRLANATTCHDAVRHCRRRAPDAFHAAHVKKVTMSMRARQFASGWRCTVFSSQSWLRLRLPWGGLRLDRRLRRRQPDWFSPGRANRAVHDPGARRRLWWT